jgi:hypothetical protein
MSASAQKYPLPLLEVTVPVVVPVVVSIMVVSFVAASRITLLATGTPLLRSCYDRDSLLINSAIASRKPEERFKPFDLAIAVNLATCVESKNKQCFFNIV